eukprot:7536233-Alexandrium_andersonii.AAC.1
MSGNKGPAVCGLSLRVEGEGSILEYSSFQFGHVLPSLGSLARTPRGAASVGKQPHPERAGAGDPGRAPRRA